MTPPETNSIRTLIRTLVGVLLVSSGLLVGLGIVQFAFFEHSQVVEDEVFGDLFLVAVHTALALAAAAVIGRGGRAAPMYVAMAAAVGACVMWMLLIHFDRILNGRAEEHVARLGGTCLLVSFWLVYVEVISLTDAQQNSVKGLRSAIRLIAFAFGGLALVVIWLGEELGDILGYTAMEAITATLVILGVITLVGPVVLRSVAKRERWKVARAATTLRRQMRLELQCPRCDEELVSAPGATRCRACDFAMVIEVEEPRCACGYLIYEHTSDRCPECGLTIAPDLRWCGIAPPPMVAISPPDHPPTSPTPVIEP